MRPINKLTIFVEIYFSLEYAFRSIYMRFSWILKKQAWFFTSEATHSRRPKLMLEKDVQTEVSKPFYQGRLGLLDTPGSMKKIFLIYIIFGTRLSVRLSVSHLYWWRLRAVSRRLSGALGLPRSIFQKLSESHIWPQKYLLLQREKNMTL